MRIFSRSSLSVASIALLSACTSVGQSSPPMASGVQPQSAQAHEVSSIQQMLDAAPQIEGGRVTFKPLHIQPTAAAPAIMLNFLAEGPNQGGVPCINCVNGASTGDNVGLTGPSSYVVTNYVWQYGLAATDISYKGKCKLAFAITNGKTKIDSFGATVNLASSGGFLLYALARNRPSYSGPATFTGSIKCGRISEMQQVPLYFQ